VSREGPDEDEVVATEQQLSTDFCQQHLDVEVSLVDRVRGAVREAAGLPLLRTRTGRKTLVEDYELIGDAARFSQKRRTFGWFEMSV